MHSKIYSTRRLTCVVNHDLHFVPSMVEASALVALSLYIPVIVIQLSVAVVEARKYCVPYHHTYQLFRYSNSSKLSNVLSNIETFALNQQKVIFLGYQDLAWSHKTSLMISKDTKWIVCEVELNITYDLDNFKYVINFQSFMNSFDEARFLIHQQHLLVYVTGHAQPFRPEGFITNRKGHVLWSVIPRYQSMRLRTKSLYQKVKIVLSTGYPSNATFKVKPTLLFILLLLYICFFFFHQMIFTVQVPCKKHSYRCQKNLCIRTSLVCDDNRNCPLLSREILFMDQENDEESCKLNIEHLMQLIIVIVVVFVFLLLFIAIQLRRLGRQRIQGNFMEIFRLQPEVSHSGVQPPLETVNAISSSFLPRSPPPYDRSSRKARPGGHDEPPSYDEAEGPSVSAPKTAAVVARFSARGSDSSNKSHIQMSSKTSSPASE